jgi:hypothetical protein
MRKQTLNFVIDTFALLSVLAMIGTGIVLRYTLPPGSNGRGLSLWGWGRHDWGDVHFWLALGLAISLLLHVALHWRWVCETVRGWAPARESPRGRMSLGGLTLSGSAFVVALVCLVAGLVWVADANIATTQRGGGQGQGYRGGQESRMASGDRVGARDQRTVPVSPTRDSADGRGKRNRRGWATDRAAVVVPPANAGPAPSESGP